MKKSNSLRIINIVGARPNFMKIAPLMAEYKKHPEIEPILVHTGQHYSEEMSQLFFDQLEIPRPNINLEVGSATHAVQTAEIMKRFEPIILDYNPDVVLVVGDVNSTLACALVAVKMDVKVAHVEAGLRSYDRQMPEEINRILTDSISDILFCTEKSGMDNLVREGLADEKIFLVGNLMIDTLLKNKVKVDESRILDELGLEPEGYGVMTLHRPSNVDNPEVFGRILDALELIQRDVPILFPIHPRTSKNFDGSALRERIRSIPNLRLLKPLGYLDFIKLMKTSRFVLTDSGGIQEETTVLNIPCFTLREKTERPITTEMGSSKLVGTDTNRILSAYHTVASGQWSDADIPSLWDGMAAERIVNILIRELSMYSV
jgi:UDP-N-acetylglucosamine 2-epimerase (non-hydrolysing)